MSRESVGSKAARKAQSSRAGMEGGGGGKRGDVEQGAGAAVRKHRGNLRACLSLTRVVGNSRAELETFIHKFIADGERKRIPSVTSLKAIQNGNSYHI